MRWLFLLLFMLPGLASAATSNVFTSSRATVSLISATNAASNGSVQLALKFQLAPGWHIYWSNPGDAGLSPQITLDPPAAVAGENRRHGAEASSPNRSASASYWPTVKRDEWFCG